MTWLSVTRQCLYCQIVFAVFRYHFTLILYHCIHKWLLLWNVFFCFDFFDIITWSGTRNIFKKKNENCSKSQSNKIKQWERKNANKTKQKLKCILSVSNMWYKQWHQCRAQNSISIYIMLSLSCRLSFVGVIFNVTK